MKEQQFDRKLLSQVVGLILEHKIPEKIVLFGSRAGKNFKETSDIDIAIFAKDWTDIDFNLVKNDLEEFIKTPLKFDLINFYGIKKELLKEKIVKEGEVLYEQRKNSGTSF